MLHWAGDEEAAECIMAHAVQRHDALPADLAGQPPLIWERAVLGYEASRLLMSRGRYAEALPYLAGRRSGCARSTRRTRRTG